MPSENQPFIETYTAQIFRALELSAKAIWQHLENAELDNLHTWGQLDFAAPTLARAAVKLAAQTGADCQLDSDELAELKQLAAIHELN